MASKKMVNNFIHAIEMPIIPTIEKLIVSAIINLDWMY